MIIAVTGILGSGKTTVSKMFEQLGAELIEVDKLGWKVLEEKRRRLLLDD